MPNVKPWIALLHVRPLPGCVDEMGGAAGAYANVLALAASPDEYRELVEAEMESLNLSIAEVHDLRPYLPDEDGDAEIAECAERLSEEWPVQYQTFDTYLADDA